MSLKNCLRLAQNSRTLLTLTPKSSSVLPLAIVPQRLSSTIGPFFTDYHRKRKKEWQKPRKAKETEQKQESSRKTESSAAEAAPKLPPTHMLYTIPELLPTTYWGHRDSVREALERVDLAKRRGVLKVPEFYVGSIMSVTVADDMSPTKQTKFVGICIEKVGDGVDITADSRFKENGSVKSLCITSLLTNIGSLKALFLLLMELITLRLNGHWA